MLSLIAISSVLAAFTILIMLAIIDLKTWLLPNEYVFGVFLTGISFHFALDYSLVSKQDIIIGACVGGGILYMIRFLAEKFYQPDALGLGDVKLMGAAGIWLGPYYILIALTLGAMTGIVHGLGLAIMRKDFNFNTLQLPAGPGFILGILATALYAFKDFPSMITP